jgi:nucleoside phosphorylase
LAAGAKAGRIHSASRVAITRKEKSELRTTTGADVVDMESAAIREACAGVNIPCACVRAISDTAQENLPFDFNGLMTPDQRFSYRRLFLAMMQNPFAVPALARLGNNSALAAEKLAQVLKKVI